MTLVGVAAYYISAPTASSDFARPVTRRYASELEPLITPTLVVMRSWRAAKRARGAIARGPAADASRDGRRRGESARPRARYVAIIADGNGRWARSRRLPTTMGTRQAPTR